MMNKSAVILYYCDSQAYVPMQELCLAEELISVGVGVRIFPVMSNENLANVARHIQKMNPTCIISWMQRPYVTARHFTRFSRLSSLFSVPHYFGGIFATMLGDAIHKNVPGVDAVFKGYHLAKIAGLISSKSALSGSFETPGYIQLDKYRLDFDLIEQIDRLRGDKIYGYMTSLSCPNNCYFCFNNILRKFGARYSARTLEQVKNDLTRMCSLFGTNTVAIKDLNFFHSSYALELLYFTKNSGIEISGNLDITLTEISEPLIRELSENIGITDLFFGLESFNKETLQCFNKNEPIDKLDDIVKWIDKYHVRLHGIVMYGLPWDTMDSLKKEINKALYYMAFSKNIFIRFSPYMPLPYSTLQEKHFPHYFEKLDIFEIISLFDTDRFKKRNFIQHEKFGKFDYNCLDSVSRNMLSLRGRIAKKTSKPKYFIAKIAYTIYEHQLRHLKFNFFTKILNFLLKYYMIINNNHKTFFKVFHQVDVKNTRNF